VHTYCLVETAWGQFGLVARGKQLAATYLPTGDTDRLIQRIGCEFPEAAYDPYVLAPVQLAVRDYFAGKRVTFDVSVFYDDATDFTLDILRACRRIGYGQTCTYAELARRAKRPSAARAAGNVMARNRHPLIIPCHRVVASGSHVGGFSSDGGVAQKEALLALEGNGR